MINLLKWFLTLTSSLLSERLNTRYKRITNICDKNPKKQTLRFKFIFQESCRVQGGTILLSRGGARRRTGSLRLFLADAILLELSHEGGLVRGGLETTVSKLGTGIDELQVDLLQSRPLGVHQQRLKHIQTLCNIVHMQTNTSQI